MIWCVRAYVPTNITCVRSRFHLWFVSHFVSYHVKGRSINVYHVSHKDQKRLLSTLSIEKDVFIYIIFIPYKRKSLLNLLGRLPVSFLLFFSLFRSFLITKFISNRIGFVRATPLNLYYPIIIPHTQEYLKTNMRYKWIFSINENLLASIFI